MKKQILFILNIFIFNFCNAQNYRAENKLWNCLNETFQEYNLNLQNELENFEKDLIQSGILKDNSGESYYNIFEQIKSLENINLEFEYSLLDTLKAHSDTFNLNSTLPKCLLSIEDFKSKKYYQKSKLFELNIVLNTFKDSTYISLSNIANVICKILSPEDFEHKYYKMTTLMLLATTRDTDSGLLKKIPDQTEEYKSKTKKRNLLNVYIATDVDSVFVNDKKIQISELSGLVKKYILSDSTNSLMPELQTVNIDLLGQCQQSKLIVSLQNEIETKYKTYLSVQNQLTDAYNSVRNDKALEYFNREFELLSDEEKKAIKELIPIRITETEPK
ncbi:hypothetical protein [Saccharicrinis sp. FJH54]|uniref:hypothetical protein n=1 Tax=Saccharicrinis sp. FJH54 TaxID=3344665 RepID=UPI0035D4C88F